MGRKKKTTEKKYEKLGCHWHCPCEYCKEDESMNSV